MYDNVIFLFDIILHNKSNHREFSHQFFYSFYDPNPSRYRGQFHDWLKTEIKPRFCRTSENYFSGSHLKVQVKLPLKIEK